ncbi:MAG TPA: phytanoyl-CoA dioxygenase family protein [Pyrinomonadaceae bacterium]|nr:phytanoyl-CoA dioxygenase family protein [Pyrinomonadaceae bacterium]
MKEQSIKEMYNENGFYLAEGLFSADEVEQVRREAKNIFDIQLREHEFFCQDIDDDQDFERNLRELFNQDYDAFLGAAKLSQHLISLHRLALDERIVNVLNNELGMALPTICVKPIIYFNSPHLAKIEGHYKTPAHQDWRSMQGSLDSIIVWIGLMDIDRDLGALEIVPQSHRRGLFETVEDGWYRTIKEGSISEDAFRRVEIKAGDALFFSSLLIHRSGNNVTDRIRWSAHFRYNNALEETFIERKFPHPYLVYRPQQELITKDFPTPEIMDKVFSS